MTLKQNSGFTLIEVALAVAILGVGLITLIGLQSRYAADYAREQDLTKAALYAQYLMSVSEADDELPEESSRRGDLYDALEKLGYFEDLDEEKQNERDALSGWSYEMSVTHLSVPPLENILDRIDLTISWGEGRTFNLVYFVEGPGADQAQ